MKTLNNKQHTVDILFVLALFSVFALSSLAVVYIGSQVYSDTAETMDVHFHNYVAIDYIVEKVHRNDEGNNIEVQSINDMNVLCIHQTVDNKSYTTYLYTYNQQLMELLISDEDDFDKENGTALMTVDSLNFSIQDSLLSVSLSINEKSHQSYISLKKGGTLL